jgi:hypothetical protein
MPACGPTFGSGDRSAAGSAGASAQNGGSSGRGSTQGGSAGAGNATVAGTSGSTSRAGNGGRAGAGASAGRPAAGSAGEADAGEDSAMGGSTAVAGAAGTGGSGAEGGSATGGSSGAGGSATAGSSGLAGFGGFGGVSGFGGLSGLGGGSGVGGAAGSLSGAAGIAGAAGAPARCMPALVVDDMEDGNALTCPNQGRSGDWWTATGTQTGSISPPTEGSFPAFALGSDARAGSSYGMRLSGTNFGQSDADWASLGFYLAGEAAYDLAPYQGLAFYAKSRGAPVTIHVKFATSTTTPVSEGGDCQDDCNDHYASVLTFDGTWREFSIAFADVAQENWGPKAKDLEHTLFVYFGYLGTDLGPAAFDFLIDDVRLY